MDERPDAPPPGAAEAARHLAGSLLGLAQTRLAILGTELEEERIRLTGALVLAVCALFCLQIALALIAAFIVVAFWETHGLRTLGVLAAIFAIVTVVLGLLARGRAAQRSRLFQTTIRELAKDRAHFDS
jgi:uncharacterized membrane protein YqjE